MPQPTGWSWMKRKGDARYQDAKVHQKPSAKNVTSTSVSHPPFVSLQELEDVLHSGPHSCHHGDEVWPQLYLGDMVMSHDKFLLWQLGITHVLNASHGKLCCRGSDDFYGTTVKYYGVPANDLPTFDLSPFFYPAAEFIHQALTSGGKVRCNVASRDLSTEELWSQYRHGMVTALSSSMFRVFLGSRNTTPDMGTVMSHTISCLSKRCSK
uniref:Dual specificity protein phosphatase n=1 Tax=Oryzias melastigma TaxID=30732 RepID=A0A3B3B6R0_ORYME